VWGVNASALSAIPPPPRNDLPLPLFLLLSAFIASPSWHPCSFMYALHLAIQDMFPFFAILFCVGIVVDIVVLII
jgi:hypothetical protein